MPFSFTLDEHISAPQDHVFAVASNLDRAPEWMNGLVRITKVGDSPFGVGTEWDETRKMFGKEATEHFQVTEYDPPRTIGLYVDGSKGSSKKGEYRFRYSIEPADGGSRVVLSGTVAMPGLVAAVFGKLLGGFFKGAMKKDLRSMKRFAEQTAA